MIALALRRRVPLVRSYRAFRTTISGATSSRFENSVKMIQHFMKYIPLLTNSCAGLGDRAKYLSDQDEVLRSIANKPESYLPHSAKSKDLNVKSIEIGDILNQNLNNHSLIELNENNTLQTVIAAINNSKEMPYLHTEKSFVFFRHNNIKTISMRTFAVMLKHVYNLHAVEIEHLIASNDIEECRQILQSMEGKNIRDIIIVNVYNCHHYVAIPKFMLLNNDNSVKMVGFVADINDKKELFGLNTNLSFSTYCVKFIESNKFCFIKSLLVFGFSEQLLLAYMFQYLDRTVFYNSLLSGEIKLLDYLKFLKPFLRATDNNVFVISPFNNENNSDDSIKQGSYLWPFTANLVMNLTPCENDNDRWEVKICYNFEVGNLKMIENNFISKITTDSEQNLRLI